MATIEKFEEIIAWQRARELSKIIYGLTHDKDLLKDFKLKEQMRGSSGSIMDNIAEGFERDGNKEFIQFLYISKGSCGELKSQMYRVLDQSYTDEKTFEDISLKIDEVSGMIGSLINYLKKCNYKGNKYKEREISNQKESNFKSKN